MSPPASLHATVFARRAFPWLVGTVALLLRTRPVELVPPNPCPGLPELLAVGAFTVWSQVSAGTVFGALHAAAFLMAIAALVALLARTTGNLAVAGAVGLALAVGPLLPTTLAPPWEAAAIAVCAALALVASRIAEGRRSYGLAFSAALVSLLAASIVPPWTVMAAIGGAVAVARAWPDVAGAWRAGVGSALTLVAILVALVSWSRPDLLTASSLSWSWSPVAACVLPQPPSQLADLVRATLPPTGPLALALAAFGLFSLGERIVNRSRGSDTSPAGGPERPPAIVAGALALVCLAPVLAGDIDSGIAVAPWIVTLWWLTATGLAAAIRIVGRRTGTVAAVLLLALLPALQASRWARSPRDLALPMGHETVTAQAVRAMLNVVPTGAAFAEEDASVEIQLRAAALGGRRARKPFMVVPRDREPVQRSLAERPTYAFPLAQRELGYRGFASEPVSAPRQRPDGTVEPHGGLAVVTAVLPCRDLDDEWMDVSETTAGGRIALVADRDAARGSLMLYLGAAVPVEPSPDGWSSRLLRGFRQESLDRQAEDRSTRFLGDARAAGLAVDHPVLLAPFVAMLSVSRIAGAPLALPVRLGAPVLGAVARRVEGSTGEGRLTICAAPPGEVTPLS